MCMKTLKLYTPLWQGGNNPKYSFGAEMLNLLFPTTEGMTEIAIEIDKDFQEERPQEDGITAKRELIEIIQKSLDTIEEHNPERIITLGGDCLVSQAPFSYLNNKYDNVGVLWLDAHPDISNPDMHTNAHAMVLANLLGLGEEDLNALVAKKFNKEQILYIGLEEGTPKEEDLLAQLQIDTITTQEATQSPEKIAEWIQENNFSHILVHFDVDVLDRNAHGSYVMGAGGNAADGGAGHLGLEIVGEIIKIAAQESSLVGLSITEFFLHEAYTFKQFLEDLPVFD